jgi:hypothetical protein
MKYVLKIRCIINYRSNADTLLIILKKIKEGQRVSIAQKDGAGARRRLAAAGVLSLAFVQTPPRSIVVDVPVILNCSFAIVVREYICAHELIKFNFF